MPIIFYWYKSFRKISHLENEFSGDLGGEMWTIEVETGGLFLLLGAGSIGLKKYINL